VNDDRKVVADILPLIFPPPPPASTSREPEGSLEVSASLIEAGFIGGPSPLRSFTPRGAGGLEEVPDIACELVIVVVVDRASGTCSCHAGKVLEVAVDGVRKVVERVTREVFVNVQIFGNVRKLFCKLLCRMPVYNLWPRCIFSSVLDEGSIDDVLEVTVVMFRAFPSYAASEPEGSQAVGTGP